MKKFKIYKKHIQKNKYTRTGWVRKDTKAVVLHWTATPTAPAINIVNWFGKQAKRDNPSYASAHYVVGLDGEVLECVPPDEYCRHVGSETYTDLGNLLMMGDKYKSPSWTCVGIEMCHEDKTGQFNARTIEGAQKLARYLLDMYGLQEGAITTHHAIVGWKKCPKWYVDNPQDLSRFTEGVRGLKK